MENKNIGRVASVTNSKCCQLRMNVVAAIPPAANANPMSSAVGSASTAHHECTSCMASMTIMNAVPYSPPRISAQEISPSAMSPARIGVDRAAS